jgi:hypothetical protein
VSLDYPGAVQAGVLVVEPDGFSSDGDAYTLEGVSRPAPTGPPTLTTLNPASVAIASLPRNVDITGSGFTRECKVLFGVASPVTQYVSDKTLRFRLDPASWQPGAVNVVVNSGDRGASNALPLTLT